MKEIMIIIVCDFITTSGLGPKTITISLLHLSQLAGKNSNLKYWDILT